MVSLRRSLMVVLVPLILFLGGGGYHQKEGLSHSKFELPYVYKLDKGLSVKKTLRYPDITWTFQNGSSCVNQSDYINYIQFIIQLNSVLDQYEAAREEGE